MKTFFLETHDFEDENCKKTHDNITLINSAIVACDKPTEVNLVRDKQKVGHP